MFPTTPNFRLLLFVFCLLIFDFCCAYQSPYSRTSTVFSRQDETRLASPVTVTTTEKITTDVGTFTQTCIITLTPIVVNGVDMVREDKTCMVTPDDGDSSAVPPATSTSSSDSLSSTSTVTPPTSTSTPPPYGGVSSSTTDGLSSMSLPLSDSTITGLPPSSSGSVPPPVISITLTSVPSPDATNSVASPPGDTNTSSDTPSSVPDPVATPQPGTDSPTAVSPPPSPTPSPLPESSSSSSSVLSPTASPESAGAAAPFDPPGKKLEVLPIGLGVFAGVSVIALLVVGIVTYERTKHRRNFRRRRQEEVNRMGYGTV